MYKGFSHKGTLHNPMTFASSLPDDVPIVLVFGAQATRGIEAADHPYVSNVLYINVVMLILCMFIQLQGLVSISEYPLSGVVAINRVLGAIENHWGIV